MSNQMIPEEIRGILSDEELDKLEAFVRDLGNKMLQQETSPWGYNLCFTISQLGTRVFVTGKDIEPGEDVLVIRED